MPHRLRFFADKVHAETVAFTPDCHVHQVHLATGDPEADGHHWTFMRDLADDDGVCTVREIQQVTIYGGIRRFSASRTAIRCDFDADRWGEVGFSGLDISLEMDDDTWASASKTLDAIFKGEPYYERS